MTTKAASQITIQLAAIGIFLSACQSLSPTPSPEQMASGDFGPKPDNIKEILVSHLSESLFDPDSLKQFSVSDPTKCGKKKGLGTPVYGWCATYEYNAKNRFGGYVGKTAHAVMIFNGQVIFEDGLFAN